MVFDLLEFPHASLNLSGYINLLTISKKYFIYKGGAHGSCHWLCGGRSCCAVAVPSMASGIVSVLCPLGKEIIQGGLVAYATVSEMVSETGEHFNDIVAEVKAEIEHHDQCLEPIAGSGL